MRSRWWPIVGTSSTLPVNLAAVPIIYFDLSAPQEAEWKAHTILVPSTR